MRMRDDPTLMVTQQAGHNAALDGARTPRIEANDPSGHVRQQIDANPEVKAAINDQLSDRGSRFGVSVPDMEMTPLNDALERATGQKYRTHSVAPEDGNGGPRTFTRDTVPHDQIRAAAEAGMPVMFSLFGHEHAIVGVTRAPDGTVQYLVHDPMTGRTVPTAADAMNGLVRTITLPEPPDTVDGTVRPTTAQQEQVGGLRRDLDLPNPRPEDRTLSPAALLEQAVAPRSDTERAQAKAEFLRRLSAGELTPQEIARMAPAMADGDARQTEIWMKATKLGTDLTPATGTPGHVAATVRDGDQIIGHSSFGPATAEELARRQSLASQHPELQSVPGEVAPVEARTDMGRGGAPLEPTDGRVARDMPVRNKPGELYDATNDPFRVAKDGSLIRQDGSLIVHPDLVPTDALLQSIEAAKQRQALVGTAQSESSLRLAKLEAIVAADPDSAPFMQDAIDSLRQRVTEEASRPVSSSPETRAAVDTQRAEFEYQLASTVMSPELQSTELGQRRMTTLADGTVTSQAQNCATDLMWRLHEIGTLTDRDIVMLLGSMEGAQPRTRTPQNPEGNSGTDLTPQALFEHLQWLDYEHRMRLAEQQRLQQSGGGE
jgi:hypothetical protein